MCGRFDFFFLLRSDLGQNKTRVCCLHSKIAFAAYRYHFAKRESNPTAHVVQLTSRESPTITTHQHKTFIYNSPLYTMFFFLFLNASSSPLSGWFCHLHSPPAILFLTKTLLFHVSLTGPGLTNHQNIISKFLSNSLTLPTLNQSNPRLEMFCSHSRTKKLLYLR